MAEIEEILRGGVIGDGEPFLDWIDRANEIARQDVYGLKPEDRFVFAKYLHSIGLKELRWESAGNWKKDERVTLTYLVFMPVEEDVRIGPEIDWMSDCYEWVMLHRNHSKRKSREWRGTEFWLEYHSAPEQYRAEILHILEEAKIGELPYSIFLAFGGASTDIGVISRVLTARGILKIRLEADLNAKPGVWSSSLVIDLPPGELSDNPNMPPQVLAKVVARTMRISDAYFLKKTEVWMPFEMSIPQNERSRKLLQMFQQREKWWR